MCFTIGLENKISSSENIENLVMEFEKNGIFHSIYYTKNNDKIFIKTFLEKDDLRKKACDIFSNYIFENHIKYCVFKYINNFYSYFDKNEKEEIYEFFASKREKKYISKKIYDYLLDSKSFFIEGFINFRLKEYLILIEDKIEIIVEDMLAKKEYNEFIKLLKYFVNEQNSKYEIINILKSKNGAYFLYDENGERIKNQERQEFMFEIADEEFCINDVLINDLISLSPKKIIIHNKENFENKEILNTVESIFEDKYDYCDGCNMCMINK